MKWHHENVVVACLSADEVHKPSGDPQDKSHPLKIILNTRRKYQELFWKSPEILDSWEKSHFWWAARYPCKEDNAKRINSFGLMVEKLWLFEALWNWMKLEFK